ncbi:hypothetical protein PV08_08375 [Exophiala spinifera]|uniref:Heterokaryon incompatibility domain-containing protein n=1 Tax=Exophiala spinifera TaxID=91928 RepID=A0A0D2B2N0_9EURO|nr:uncharacterized protein PV08_08375 [Exophiala spinifera]KIW13188.1 hypothetical protein PV08_08375 [Exophiala spinifera]
MAFAYSDLEAGFVRLFQILPGANESELSLKLVHKPLQTDQASQPGGEKAEYHALSYTWGPETPKFHISVNGASFEIRKNLWDFLWRLRWRERLAGRGQGNWFWADAICINQQRTTERTQQVAIMGTIYSSAWTVLAWLGEAADHSDIALDPDMIVGVLSSGDFSSESSQLRSAQYQLPMWQALVAITRRPYWRRAWVMQEVALAQGLIYVMCGEESVPYSRLAGSLRSATLPLLCDDIFTLPPDPEADQESAIQKIRHITQELAEFEPPHYKHEPDLMQGAHGSKMRLFDLLLDYAHKECSEPRDKIFSLLAMAADTREGGHPVRVDYSKSVEELFFQVLAFCRTPTHEAWGTSFATFGYTLFRSLGLSMPGLLQYLRTRESSRAASSSAQESTFQSQLPVYFKSIGTARNPTMIDVPEQNLIPGASSLPIIVFEIVPNIRDPMLQTETRSRGFSILPCQDGDRVYQGLDTDTSLIIRTIEHMNVLIGWALVLPDSEWLPKTSDLARLGVLLDHDERLTGQEIDPTDAEIFMLMGEPRYAIQIPLPVALCVIAGCLKPYKKVGGRTFPRHDPGVEARRSIREQGDQECSQSSGSLPVAGSPSTDRLGQAHSQSGSHPGQPLSSSPSDSDVEEPPRGRDSAIEQRPRVPIDLETHPATNLAKRLLRWWE